jgi:hypothetical protein
VGFGLHGIAALDDKIWDSENVASRAPNTYSMNQRTTFDISSILENCSDFNVFADSRSVAPLAGGKVRVVPRGAS